MNPKSYSPNYVLIDYENVQPTNLTLLTQDHFHVDLFLGAKQTRIPVELAEAMHSLGPDRARYVRITQSQSNALDFHIAYFLGALVSKHPTAFFHVISKDKGYDPLIEYMRQQNVRIQRRETLTEIPILAIQKDSAIGEKYSAFLENLIGRGKSRPRRVLSLKNTMKNTFGGDLSDTEVDQIFARLIKSKKVKMEGAKISYALPKTAVSEPG